MEKTKQYYNLTSDQSIIEQNSSEDGLSSHEVERRLLKYGPNELKGKSKSIWLKLIEPFASLFVGILILALLLSIIKHEMLDAIVIGVVLVVNAIIYYFQQASVERALKALKKSDREVISVRRDNKVIQLQSEKLVPGDIVLLQEGIKIPADGRIIREDQLSVDESVLTGESLPVHKKIEPLTGAKQAFDQKNMAFKGTFVYSGSGEMLITATGNQTMLGQISALTTKNTIEQSPIEQKIDQLTKKLIITIVVVGLIVFGLSLMRGLGLDEGLRFSVALVVSAVPEGLPIALTVVLFLSAKKMAQSKALVKKIASIETLGAVTLIATDKTGTLTQNKLTVADKEVTTLPQFLTNAAGSINGEHGSHYVDILDEVLAKELDTHKHLPKGKKVKEFPFVQDLRVSGSIWHHNGVYTLYLKGAPESLLAYAGKPKINQHFHDAVSRFAENGYRNIGFAQIAIKKVPDALHKSMLKNCEIEGILGLSDPLRRGIAKSVREANAAGIGVVMLTGDHKKTAFQIAKEAGIAKHEAQVADGSLLGELSLQKIRSIVESTRVFSRVLPEYKYRFLEAVKHHEVTAMTGDGINDIPAIVEADVGLAMGNGTDATKEASDIVILNNSFSTILAAIRSGRTVIANIRKMLFYLLSTSLGEGIIMISALVFIGPELPILATQILWINLVTDGFTVIPLGLSAAESKQMKQPPRRPDAPILNAEMLSRLILVASVMALATLWLFNYYRPMGYEYANSLAFLSLVACQWVNSLNANYEFKSWTYNFIKPNWKLMLALVAAIGVQMLVAFGPLQSTFSVVDLAWKDILVGGIPPLLVLIAGDMHKGILHVLKKDQKANA